jgi:hypothetical protein
VLRSGHRTRLSPRIIPGPSQFAALFLRGNHGSIFLKIACSQWRGTITKATDNLSKAGWSWGCISAIDSNGRTIWIADAHRDDEKRFVARADEKLTAFIELGRVTRELFRLLNAE